jgi:hypothetical protein
MREVQVFVAQVLSRAKFHLVALNPKQVELIDQMICSLPKDKLLIE